VRIVEALLDMTRIGSGMPIQLEAGCSAEVPVIITTAHGTIDLAVEAVRKGASGFVTKPFHHRDLLRRISRAVGEARARTAR